MSSCVEEDSTAGEIDGLSRPRIQHATPTDELPFQLQLQVISPVLAMVRADRIALGCRFLQKRRGIHYFFSLPSPMLSTLCGSFRQNNSHASTPGVLAVLRRRLITLGERVRLRWDNPGALPRWACYPLKGSQIFPVAEGVVNRAWFRSLLPAPLRGSTGVRAGSPGAPQKGTGTPGAPKEGKRVYPAQRAALHRARTARIARGVVSYPGERGQRSRPRWGNRSRPYVRAPGLQGYGIHRHAQRAGRKESSRHRRRGLRPNGGGSQ